jgi:hypothetical protein
MKNKLFLALLLVFFASLPFLSAQEPKDTAEQEEDHIIPDRAEVPGDVALIMALARTLDEIAVLLPEAGKKQARKLYKDDRETLLDELALGNLGRRAGYTVRRGKEPGVVAYAEKDGKREIELRVFHEIIAGDSAILFMGLCTVAEGCPDERIQAWLKNEDNSWRLIHLAEIKTEMNLDEAAFFDHVREKAIEKREERAARIMSEFQSSLAKYTEAYPERGIPSDLQPLLDSVDSVKGVSIDSVLRCRRSRCVGEGYVFTYESTGTGYQISAQPSRRNVTGVLSLWMSHSSQIHCTPDERIPSERDPIVKGQSITACRQAPKDEASTEQ